MMDIFYWGKNLGAAMDVDVAACAQIVIYLADAAKLAAAGARDGDERCEDDAEHLDVHMDVDLVQHEIGVLRQVVGRAVAVGVLPGVLLELGTSRRLGLALRRQVSLRKKDAVCRTCS